MVRLFWISDKAANETIRNIIDTIPVQVRSSFYAKEYRSA